MPSIEHNKALIRDFYRRCVANGDLEFAHQLIADDYIQHSPLVKPGKTGLLEALAYMKQLPKPASSTQPFMRLIAEGDFVVTHMAFSLGGQSKVVVDLFRLHNGQIAEHWDAMEDQPETSRNGHSMLDGPGETEDFSLTDSNKKMVGDFFQRVLLPQAWDLLPDYVAPNLIQHNPAIADGLDGLTESVRATTGGFAARKIHRMIGEGNFVVVQSEGPFREKPATFYDVFRLKAGLIVEQWQVKQIVP
ncbi:nuclear transport factor 2 family protein [Larkinella bovis]|uniref:Nuclear transport factor 2 family protein n=1 Tax=Larkinella bovis TaxID=683041 RepID=A0ABW0IB97_9BACT